MQHLVVGLLVYLAQSLGGSFGWAILALSLGIRVALLPLTLRLARRGLRNQEILRQLQPEIEKLKERYAGQPDRLLPAMTELYRKHGYSPFDVPALLGSFIQLPVFGILYRAIAAILLEGGRFLWVRSLAVPDIGITAIVVTITWAAAYFLPHGPGVSRTAAISVQLVITFLLVWRLAAGYGLYWVSSAVVSLGQSLWLRRTHSPGTF